MSLSDNSSLCVWEPTKQIVYDSVSLSLRLQYRHLCTVRLYWDKRGSTDGKSSIRFTLLPWLIQRIGRLFCKTSPAFCNNVKEVMIVNSAHRRFFFCLYFPPFFVWTRYIAFYKFVGVPFSGLCQSKLSRHRLHRGKQGRSSLASSSASPGQGEHPIAAGICPRITPSF